MINLFSLIQDYIVDTEDGIRQLITWFLNVVMEEEALIQAGAQRYKRTDSRKASRNGYKPRTLLTKYGGKSTVSRKFCKF
jgi:putative transposase